MSIFFEKIDKNTEKHVTRTNFFEGGKEKRQEIAVTRACVCYPCNDGPCLGCDLCGNPYCASSACNCPCRLIINSASSSQTSHAKVDDATADAAFEANSHSFYEQVQEGIAQGTSSGLANKA